MTKWAGYPVLPNHDGKTINVTDNTILVTVSKYVTGNLSWITRFLVVESNETFERAIREWYCSTTVANQQLITVIRFVAKSYTHL